MKDLDLGNYHPLGAVKDINIFGKLFDFLKAHTKRAAIGCPAISRFQF